MKTATTNTRQGWRRLGWRRLGGLVAALALTVALGLGTGRANAQPLLELPGPQLVGGFPVLSLTYTDAQGAGRVTIIPQGPDPASGGTAIAVRLVQNGISYTGGGFARPGELGGYVVDFTVTGLYGDSYHLSGTLVHDQDGVRWRGQGRWWATWNRAITDEWRLAGGPYAEPPSRPTLSATVRLEPVGGWWASGSVVLTALPEGETRFELQLAGLLPGQRDGMQLLAGTPAPPRASFTQVATVTADAEGRANAIGLVRFRGTQAIPLLDIAGGGHFIAIVGSEHTVAAGAIPALEPLG